LFIVEYKIKLLQRII